MTKLMRQKNEEKSQREGEAAKESGRMAIEELQGTNKFIDRDCLVVIVGSGKLSAGCEASTEGKEKQYNGYKQSPQGRTPASESKVGFRRRKRRPVKSGGGCISWKRVGHEEFGGSISI